jgi:hypothetical protein
MSTDHVCGGSIPDEIFVVVEGVGVEEEQEFLLEGAGAVMFSWF